jgi:NADPH-dependent glutamate synthase beta subunit-like oxidoreductase/Pyruvate/2-oxoacid:ferredoxin oxidoreductase delta subunit
LKPKKEESNSILIVGAGIGGCQAALDLANLGFKVYLVERKPYYGEESYPTNDCSVCLHAPEIIGVEGNPNIEVITNAEIISLEGKPGNFRALIEKRPEGRSKDQSVICDECFQQSLLQGADDSETHDIKTIYPQFPEMFSLKILLEHRRIPPCENECPAHVKAQEYNSLISKSEYLEALNLIRDRCPLPSVIGRICHHPCETVCNRSEIDEPVNICGLKRFVADHVRTNLEDKIEYLEGKKDKRIAIVGSGPSGLTVAYQLARRGYTVTVFERELVPGGMLRLGVPDYRLPLDILNADIDYIKKYGVDIKTSTSIGSPGLTIKDLKKEYDAVYIGVGLQASRKLNIEGENLGNIQYAVEFLKKCALGEKLNVGKKVIVIGGGDVAVDCARSVLRKGAEEVQMVMLESEDIIPAKSWEVEEAREEGIIFNVSRGPKKFIGKNGKVTGLETLECSSVFDKDGRFNPILEACTEVIFDGDMVIVAISQAGDLAFLDKEIKIERGIAVNKNNFQTSMEGVFAGGEVVTGPGSAIQAISIGNKAAIVIDKYLKGEDISKITETIPDYNKDEIIKIEDMEGIERVQQESRNDISLISPATRINNFDEIASGFDEKTAIKEAKRCLSCGICRECLENVKACVARSLDHEESKDAFAINVNSVMLSPGESWLLCYDLRKGTNYRWKVMSPVAIIDDEKCIGCGDCIDVCLFQAIDRVETLVEYKSVRDFANPSLSLIRYKSNIISQACKGCGACVGICPVGAITLKYFSNQEIANVIQSSLN